MRSLARTYTICHSMNKQMHQETQLYTAFTSSGVSSVFWSRTIPSQDNPILCVPNVSYFNSTDVVFSVSANVGTFSDAGCSWRPINPAILCLAGFWEVVRSAHLPRSVRLGALWHVTKAKCVYGGFAMIERAHSHQKQ